jgi:pyruvate/2-oxoglutarate dehydrogenase complex dihydrolipoamide dehydrogenase (E3) component
MLSTGLSGQLLFAFKAMSDEGSLVTSVYAVGDINTHTPQLASAFQDQISIITVNIKADITSSGARSYIFI